MAPFDKITWRCGSVRLCQNKMSRRSNVSLLQGSQACRVNVVLSAFFCWRLFRFKVHCYSFSGDYSWPKISSISTADAFRLQTFLSCGCDGAAFNLIEAKKRSWRSWRSGFLHLYPDWLIPAGRLLLLTCWRPPSLLLPRWAGAASLRASCDSLVLLLIASFDTHSLRTWIV